MNPLRKLALVGAAALPALAIFTGSALADGPAAQAAEYDNLVVNGTFGTNTWPWVAAEHTSIEAKDSHAYVSNTSNAALFETTSIVSQCVPMEANSLPTFMGSVLIPSGQVRTGTAGFQLVYFKNGDCTDFVGASFPTPQASTGAWKNYKFDLDPLTAKDAQSTLIQMVVTKAPSKIVNKQLPFEAVFDVVKLLALVDPAEEPEGDGCDCTVIGGDDEPVPPLGDDEDPAEVPPAAPVEEDSPEAPAPVTGDAHSEGPLDEAPIADDGAPACGSAPGTNAGGSRPHGRPA